MEAGLLEEVDPDCLPGLRGEGAVRVVPSQQATR